MEHAAAFLRWVVEFAMSGGFWHFIGVLLIVRALTGFTTLVRWSHTNKTEKVKETK
jgi:hypothetical protein